MFVLTPLMTPKRTGSPPGVARTQPRHPCPVTRRGAQNIPKKSRNFRLPDLPDVKPCKTVKLFDQYLIYSGKAGITLYNINTC